MGAAGVSLVVDRMETKKIGVSASAIQEVRLTLALDESAHKPTAVVEIRDTGVGISPEDLPYIFERFYRAAKDRSRQTGGVGLGLSIAQWITHRHGGEIQVQSAPGAGSLFRVRLPVL